MEQFQAILRKAMAPYWKAFTQLRSEFDRVKDVVLNRPASITEEIDRILGRRIFFNYIGIQPFTSAQDGTKGDQIQFRVSQDGPFIMTHYPLAMWKPNLPTNADNFGRWSAVSSWPLPTQQNTNMDIIDISWELQDVGSGRLFQDGPVPPGLLSRPDDMVPCSVPTLFAPDVNIGFTPTYENIRFDTGPSTDTTGGTLVIALPGYRIVNL